VQLAAPPFSRIEWPKPRAAYTQGLKFAAVVDGCRGSALGRPAGVLGKRSRGVAYIQQSAVQHPYDRRQLDIELLSLAPACRGKATLRPITLRSV
jgi:hypothetical protein